MATTTTTNSVTWEPIQSQVNNLSTEVQDFIKRLFMETLTPQFHEAFKVRSYSLSRHKGGYSFHTFIFDSNDNVTIEDLAKSLEDLSSTTEDGDFINGIYENNLLFLTVIVWPSLTI